MASRWVKSPMDFISFKGEINCFLAYFSRPAPKVSARETANSSGNRQATSGHTAQLQTDVCLLRSMEQRTAYICDVHLIITLYWKKKIKPKKGRKPL